MVLEILLGLLVLGEGYVIWNLNKKTELLETWVETFTEKITTIRTNLKEIDHGGHFEADDEVGSVFERIKQIVEELDNLKGEEINANK